MQKLKIMLLLEKICQIIPPNIFTPIASNKTNNLDSFNKKSDLFSDIMVCFVFVFFIILLFVIHKYIINSDTRKY